MNKELIFFSLLAYSFNGIYSAEQKTEMNEFSFKSIQDTKENLLRIDLAQHYYHQRVCIKAFSPNEHQIDQYDDREIIKNAQLINNKFLITMSDRKIMVHDIQTDDYIFSINEKDAYHKNNLLDAQLSTKGNFLMTVSDDTVVIHDIKIKIGTIEYEYKSNKKENIQYAQLSDNETMLMIKSDNKIVLYNIQNKLQYSFNQDEISDAKLSNDGKFLIVLSGNKALLYRTENATLDLLINKDNEKINILESLSTIKLSDDDSNDTKQVKRKKHNEDYDFYQLNHDKTILVTSSNNTITIKNRQTNDTLFSINQDADLILNQLSNNIDIDIEINDKDKKIYIFKKDFTKEITEHLSSLQINQALNAQQKKEQYPFIEMYCDQQTNTLKPHFVTTEDKENSFNTIKRKKHDGN